MLVVNVQESTTTTGTSDITLAGSSEDGRTFTSQYATNERFTYVIDDRAGNWEVGSGYLSGASTLVRELPTDGSAATPVNFSAGTKQVLITALPMNTLAHSLGYSSLGGNAKFSVPSNFVNRTATQSLTANRVLFAPIFMSRGTIIDSLGVRITVGNGTGANLLHLGIYDVDPNTGEAGNLIVSTTNLDPSVAALVSGTFTERFLQAGWYYAGIWSDAAPVIRASGATNVISTPFQVNSGAGLNAVMYQYINSQTSLTDLPATGNATATATGSVPILITGHT